MSAKELKPEPDKTSITRREALAKAGKYAAFTALGSMMLLSPRQAVASSNNINGGEIDATGGNGWGTSGGTAPGGNTGTGNTTGIGGHANRSRSPWSENTSKSDMTSRNSGKSPRW
jgi:hypothetical protein